MHEGNCRRFRRHSSLCEYPAYFEPIAYFAFLTYFCRRTVLKSRAEIFSRFVCETFAFGTSEALSINSGNRLLEAVAQHLMYLLHVTVCSYLAYFVKNENIAYFTYFASNKYY